MVKTNVEIKKLKKCLRKKPKIKGINGFINFGIFDKKAGVKDANIFYRDVLFR